MAVSSVSYNLIANPGFLQPWSINTSVDIAALLTAAEVDFDLPSLLSVELPFRAASGAETPLSGRVTIIEHLAGVGSC